MADSLGLSKRWNDYKATKTVVFWSCAGSIVATLIVGFVWGGWVTGGTAGQMSRQAATEARAQLAATICVDSFAKGRDATTQLASLKTINIWSQNKFIEDGGWATLPGGKTPIDGAAALCVRQLIDTKPAG